MLPKSVISWLVCAAVFLAVESQGTGSADAGEPREPCPRKCVSIDALCNNSSGSFLCGTDLKCCLDEDAELQSTETPLLPSYDPSEAELLFRSILEPEESTESDSYEEAFDLPLQNRSGEASLKCPGTCMDSHEIRFCGYPFPLTSLCGEKTCCLSEIQAFKIQLLGRQNTDGEIPEGTAQALKIFEAGAFGDLSDVVCPYTCLRPRHVDRCAEIYPDYYCPGGARCCYESVSTPIKPEECRGRCISPHLQNFCRPPRTVSPSPSCRPPTLCCEHEPQRTPNWRSMQPEPPFYVEDKDEQFFYVSSEGLLTRLAELPPDAQPFSGQHVILEHFGQGKVYTLEDPASTLWEKYVLPEFDEGRFFGDTESGFRITREGADGFREILIPDDEDLEKAETPDLAARPPCPGSCVSYLTRFLCFRNYTIYDGFKCPGRSVCCAKLEDIKHREDYLKSIYPYLRSNLRPFNPDCGKKGRNDNSPKSLPGEWCWQVAMIDSGNQYVCSGALIEKSWAVTTAQCVAGFMAQNQPLFVRVGVNDLTSLEDNAVGQTRRISSTYLHYNFDSATLDNDIALLKLANPLSLDTNVCLACLPSRATVQPEGTQCTLHGYGFISRAEGMSLRMTETEVPLIHDLDCISNITEAMATVYLLPASSFCGGHEKDYCQGGAGNPLVCKVDGYYELTGLVSWGIGCEFEDAPSVYVKIPALMGWINHVIATDHQLY